MNAPAEGRPPAGTSGALPEEHASGFSSLSLLAPSAGRRRTLYLLAWRRAQFVCESAAEPPRSMTVAVDGWSRLPVATGSIDCTVVDLDAAPDGRDVRRSVATEIARVSDAAGCCVAVVAHRRRPRDPREWSKYRVVPPAAGWRAAFRDTPLCEQHGLGVTFDGQRLTEVRLPVASSVASAADAGADALALVLTRAGGGRSTAEDVQASLERELGGPVSLARVHVRKIGKAAAFASSAAGPVVVRLPRSSVAVERARRNHMALESLHASSLDLRLQVVPRPLARGTAGVQPYFVETVVPGAPREDVVSAPRWEPQALAFITRLHAATARRVTLGASWFETEVEPLLGSIGRVVTADDRGVLEWLRGTLRTALLGRSVPLVRSHGDFTGGNCLYERGELSGIVDWELSRPDALPLLDLLQCVDLPAEYSRDDRWLRAEIVLDAGTGRGPLSDCPELRAYMNAVGVAEDLLPPLLLMHWVDHVGARVSVRRSDARWFRRRVEAPLRHLRGLAGAATHR